MKCGPTNARASIDVTPSFSGRCIVQMVALGNKNKNGRARAVDLEVINDIMISCLLIVDEHFIAAVMPECCLEVHFTYCSVALSWPCYPQPGLAQVGTRAQPLEPGRQSQESAATAMGVGCCA